MKLRKAINGNDLTALRRIIIGATNGLCEFTAAYNTVLSSFPEKITVEPINQPQPGRLVA